MGPFSFIILCICIFFFRWKLSEFHLYCGIFIFIYSNSGFLDPSPDFCVFTLYSTILVLPLDYELQGPARALITLSPWILISPISFEWDAPRYCSLLFPTHNTNLSLHRGEDLGIVWLKVAESLVYPNSSSLSQFYLRQKTYSNNENKASVWVQMISPIFSWSLCTLGPNPASGALDPVWFCPLGPGVFRLSCASALPWST